MDASLFAEMLVDSKGIQMRILVALHDAEVAYPPSSSEMERKLSVGLEIHSRTRNDLRPPRAHDLVGREYNA